jgi:hypothetical protein
MNMQTDSATYQFTNNWFGNVAKLVWDQLIPNVNPARILEVGSYEGASTCYLIDTLSPKHSLDLHCIDTWEGGVEHTTGPGVVDMTAVEARFQHNVKLAESKAPNPINLNFYKGYSDREMARLLSSGKGSYFDFIYIDGSHQAPDVLCDALLAFRLLRVGGFIAFDDYLWSEQLSTGVDPVRCPKPAIDAFTNIYCRKVRIISAPLYQLYVQKIAD